MTDMTLLNALSDDKEFAGRHNGPDSAQQKKSCWKLSALQALIS